MKRGRTRGDSDPMMCAVAEAEPPGQDSRVVLAQGPELSFEEVMPPAIVIAEPGQGEAVEQIGVNAYITWENTRGTVMRGMVHQVTMGGLTVVTDEGVFVQVARGNTTIRKMPSPVCEECGQRVTARGCLCVDRESDGGSKRKRAA